MGHFFAEVRNCSRAMNSSPSVLPMAWKSYRCDIGGLLTFSGAGLLLYVHARARSAVDWNYMLRGRTRLLYRRTELNKTNI
ncbi:hypothetical protein E2C01_039663 [Portunus trituberculatus]|uniref:Uncharacterized protein n=1 Tax=Portunus trituberculatus TaxID=210409 RepID=A0A5B7FKD4_PORTR|nr:hypothetical protein [Portunus trituberculatus]